MDVKIHHKTTDFYIRLICITEYQSSFGFPSFNRVMYMSLYLFTLRCQFFTYVFLSSHIKRPTGLTQDTSNFLNLRFFCIFDIYTRLCDFYRLFEIFLYIYIYQPQKCDYPWKVHRNKRHNETDFKDG